MRTGKDFPKRMRKAWKDSVSGEAYALLESAVQNAESEEQSELEFVNLMDRLLDEEQRLTFWEQNGGCIGGKRNREAKEFALANAGKSLAEKISLLNNTQYLGNVVVHNDGTISSTVACHCTTLRPHKFVTSPSLYGCAAGASVYNYAIALGAMLKLKSYGAAPDATDTRRPCSFTFEIAE